MPQIIVIPVSVATLTRVDAREEPTPALRALVERFRDG